MRCIVAMYRGVPGPLMFSVPTQMSGLPWRGGWSCGVPSGLILRLPLADIVGADSCRAHPVPPPPPPPRRRDWANTKQARQSDGLAPPLAKGLPSPRWPGDRARSRLAALRWRWTTIATMWWIRRILIRLPWSTIRRIMLLKTWIRQRVGLLDVCLDGTSFMDEHWTCCIVSLENLAFTQNFNSLILFFVSGFVSVLYLWVYFEHRLDTSFA